MIAFASFALGAGYAGEPAKQPSEPESPENHAAAVRPAGPADGKQTPEKINPKDTEPAVPKDGDHLSAKSGHAGPINHQIKTALATKLPQPGKVRGWWEQVAGSTPANKPPQSALKTAVPSAKAGLTMAGSTVNKTPGTAPATTLPPGRATPAPVPAGVRNRGVTAALVGAALGVTSKNSAAALNRAAIKLKP